MYRPWHLALRLEGSYEYYRPFVFERPIEFMGRVRFNEELLTYERPRTSIDSFGAQTATFMVSLVGVW